MTARTLVPSSVVLLAMLGSSPAFALSCDEIVNMLAVNVPENIVVMTMKDSGEQFTADEVACLRGKGAPAGVIAQATAMQAAEPGASTKPAAEPTKPAKSAIDEGEDVLGSRSTKTKEDALPEQGESGGNDPSELREAVKLYKAKKPLSASLRLYQLLNEAKYPDQESQILYYLARSLQDLQLFHTAQHHFLQIVQKGHQDPYFAYAMPQLVKIARYTGDDTELARIAPQIPPEAYPRGAQAELHYLMGVRYFDKDQLAEARNSFGQVPQKSPLYLRSEYFRGVIYNQQGKLKSAVRSFRDVYREEVDYYNDPRYLKEIEDIKALSLLNVGRIYYGLERYDEAAKYYTLVDRNSTYWADSLFEHAWANFMQNNLNDTLGQVMTVQSGFYTDDVFNPEAQVLRSLTYFNLCEYKTTEKQLLTFEKTYRPMQAEMQAFLEQYSTSEGKKMADQAWDTYFGSSKKTDTVLPQSLFARTLRDKDLSGIVRHLDLMAEEEALIDKQKEAWQQDIGPYLKKVLEEDRQRLKRRAGLLFLKQLAVQNNRLTDLLSQSEIIRFEVTDAQRVDYAYKASNSGIGSAVAAVDLDFATASEYIYWPFNGEFWKDELGYYQFTEKGSCK